MKQSVNNSDFHTAFHDMNRADQFSYKALNALFAYLEEYELECETEVELDVIALCCDYSEHESALDCIEDLGHGFEPEPEDTEESTSEEAALEYLRENTQVITFEGGIIIQGF